MAEQVIWPHVLLEAELDSTIVQWKACWKRPSIFTPTAVSSIGRYLLENAADPQFGVTPHVVQAHLVELVDYFCFEDAAVHESVSFLGSALEDVAEDFDLTQSDVLTIQVVGTPASLLDVALQGVRWQDRKIGRHWAKMGASAFIAHLDFAFRSFNSKNSREQFHLYELPVIHFV